MSIGGQFRSKSVQNEVQVIEKLVDLSFFSFIPRLAFSFEPRLGCIVISYGGGDFQLFHFFETQCHVKLRRCRLQLSRRSNSVKPANHQTISDAVVRLGQPQW